MSRVAHDDSGCSDAVRALRGDRSPPRPRRRAGIRPLRSLRSLRRSDRAGGDGLGRAGAGRACRQRGGRSRSAASAGRVCRTRRASSPPSWTGRSTPASISTPTPATAGGRRIRFLPTSRAGASTASSTTRTSSSSGVSSKRPRRTPRATDPELRQARGPFRRLHGRREDRRGRAQSDPGRHDGDRRRLKDAGRSRRCSAACMPSSSGRGMLFGFGTEQDPGDATQRIAVRLGRRARPARSRLLPQDRRRHVALRAQYAEHLTRNFRLHGREPDWAAESAAIVLADRDRARARLAVAGRPARSAQGLSPDEPRRAPEADAGVRLEATTSAAAGVPAEAPAASS